MSNKLATGVYGSTNKTELDEKPDLEVAPVIEAFPPGIITNQQEGHNGETCLNVTNKKKHWWQWSGDEKKQVATGDDNLTNRVDNLEKMVGQLSASLEVTNQTALGADMDKHTKDFLKTEIDAQMAKATGRITETKQGMENNKQQIENIAQELTAKTSNLVTNQRVAKLETEINDNLVKKISKLEAVLVAGEDKINNEDIINLRAEIEKKLKKLEHESNNHSSVLSMFFDFTNILAQLDDATAHRDATIWKKTFANLCQTTLN